MMDRRLGWHFLNSDGTLENEDGRSPKVGKRLKMKTRMDFDGNMILAPAHIFVQWGMHASERILDALRYKTRSSVLVEGDIQTGDDKFCPCSPGPLSLHSYHVSSSTSSSKSRPPKPSSMWSNTSSPLGKTLSRLNAPSNMPISSGM